MDVDQIRVCPMPKSVGTSHFFKKSYKNTRTKESECLYGHSVFLMLELGLEKAARLKGG